MDDHNNNDDDVHDCDDDDENICNQSAPHPKMGGLLQELDRIIIQKKMVNGKYWNSDKSSMRCLEFR